MAMKLSTTLSHITTVPNSVNSKAITEFYQYMKEIGTSENYQNQNLKAIIVYAKFLGPEITFYDIQKREQIVTFLDTKIKSNDIDPDKKWITTWNDYLWQIKYFLRWLFLSLYMIYVINYISFYFDRIRLSWINAQEL
jgi:integrase/recombinase XerD